MSEFNSLWLNSDRHLFLIKKKKETTQRKMKNKINQRGKNKHSLQMRANNLKTVSATNISPVVSVLMSCKKSARGQNQRHISSEMTSHCKDPPPPTAWWLVHPSLRHFLGGCQIISRMSHGTKPLFFPLATRMKPLCSHSLLTQI